jgi:hypothetical protein
MIKHKKNKIIPDSALGSIQIVPKALSSKHGYAILELLFYIAFFAVLSFVVISAMMTMANSFKETTIQEQLIQSGTIMERISREIRSASDIVSISSNDLLLSTKDANGADKTVEFKFVDPNVQLWEAGANTGNLNSPNIIVTSLAFSQIITAKGKAVRIILTVKSANDALGRMQDFYDTVVPRGSY